MLDCVDLLASGKPLRVAVFLRRQSPLYLKNVDPPWEGVVAAVCSTLRVVQDRAKLMAVQKFDKLTVFALDFYHDKYDWATAHNLVDLPVVLVEYGKTKTSVKWVSRAFRSQVNKHVAEQHRLHGWQAYPPYFEDQSRKRNGVPSYRSPRNLTAGPLSSAARSAKSTGQEVDGSRGSMLGPGGVKNN
ncbi:hypothetical protein CHU98_g7895 [Xylaria longipes]|nr:hypothetical protein CHU98_g7895 [Xylaria longipes]